MDRKNFDGERNPNGRNRVDGLTRFFTDEVRLSHHVAYGSRLPAEAGTTRFAEHNATALYTNCIFVLL